MSPKRDLNVVALVYDGLSPFEYGLVVEVFGVAHPEFDQWYRFRTCSIDSGTLRVVGGLTFEASTSKRCLDGAGTIVLPGWRDPRERPPERVLAQLRRAHDRGVRILSVCSGVFVLAAAGILDGRRATTHWRHADLLSELYPDVEVDPSVLYVDEGSIMTSAGSSAGLDLCLHVVRRDFGSEVANQVARRLVMPPHRDGGQAQFVDVPMPDGGEHDVARLLDWLRANLERAHTVESIARKANMSSRTLARRFRNTVGETPHRWLTRERIQLAQRLLETTDHSIDRVARLCGMGSAQLLRLHFRRHAGTTPTAYRRCFRHVAQEPNRLTGS